MVVITYTGRRSGREITFPVNYRRTPSGDGIVIAVTSPESKTWWRNFTGDGAPVTLQMGSEVRTGHAHSVRSGRGVTMTVDLS